MPIHLRQVKLGRLSIGPHIVAVDASQRGYVLAINDRRFVMNDRVRWAMATTLVLLLHLLALWLLIVSYPKVVDLPDTDRDILHAELDQPPPEPEVQPLLRLQLVPRPVPLPQPQPQTQPEPKPQAQQQPAAQAVPAPPTPQPVPQPTPEPAKPAPQVINRPQETFDTPRTQTLQARSDVKLQSPSVPNQTLEPESKTADIRLKKKQEEELEARQTTMTALAPAAVGDVKLHEAPSQTLQTVVAPTGLTPDGTHLATGASQGGGLQAGGAAGGAADGSKTGIKGGRGVLSQALQNDDFCLKAQRDGKPLPVGCHMKSLTEMAALTTKLDPHLQKEADAHAFQQKYKTTPGNAAYWKRNSPTSNPGVRLSDDDQAGAYTDPKDQRVLAGSNPDPQNSIHQTAH